MERRTITKGIAAAVLAALLNGCAVLHRSSIPKHLKVFKSQKRVSKINRILGYYVPEKEFKQSYRYVRSGNKFKRVRQPDLVDFVTAGFIAYNKGYRGVVKNDQDFEELMRYITAQALVETDDFTSKLSENYNFFNIKEPDKRKVAFTFDCGGWGKKGLETILKTLDKYNAKSTFFISGRFINTYPDDVRLLVEKGHEIANHSYDHDRNNSPEECDMVAKMFKDFTGEEMARYFRVPYLCTVNWNEFNKAGWKKGRVDLITCDAMTGNINLQDEAFKKAFKRYVNKGASRMVALYNLPADGPGHIDKAVILMHIDGNKYHLVDFMLDYVTGKGYSQVKLSELEDKGIADYIVDGKKPFRKEGKNGAIEAENLIYAHLMHIISIKSRPYIYTGMEYLIRNKRFPKNLKRGVKRKAIRIIKRLKRCKLYDKISLGQKYIILFNACQSEASTGYSGRIAKKADEISPWFEGIYEEAEERFEKIKEDSKRIRGKPYGLFKVTLSKNKGK